MTTILWEVNKWKTVPYHMDASNCIKMTAVMEKINQTKRKMQFINFQRRCPENKKLMQRNHVMVAIEKRRAIMDELSFV